MLLLSGYGGRKELAVGESLEIGRASADLLPPDPAVSRAHLRVHVLAAAPLQVQLTQLGKYPSSVYRLADLEAIGWLAPQQDDASAGTAAAASAAPTQPAAAARVSLVGATAAQLAARAERAKPLLPGSTAILSAGDAFGIQGESQLWPFFVAGPPPASVPADEVSQASHLSRSGSHVSCASLSPHSLSRAQLGLAQPPVGPVSPFYTMLRTDSLRRVVAQAQEADGGLPVPIPARVFIEQEDASAERAAQERQQEEEKALWSRDQYPSNKRRRVMPVDPQERAAFIAGLNAPSVSITSHSALITDTQTPQQASGRILSPPPRAATAASSVSATAAAPVIAASSTGASASSVAPAAATSAAAASPSAVTPTLVLPSLSTGDFQFDPEKACPIAERALRFFLQSNPDPSLRIHMILPVDGRGELTPSARLVQSYFAAHPLEDDDDGVNQRFTLHAGDITSWESLGIRASFLAHATTYRYQGGEGGALNRFLPADFAERMHACYGAAKAGRAYHSRVDPSGALAKRCPGLVYLLSLRPPCMNEARPDALNGDYLRGCRDLREAYDALLRTFADLAKLQREPSPEMQSPAPPSQLAPAATSAAVAETGGAGDSSARAISITSSQSVLSSVSPMPASFTPSLPATSASAIPSVASASPAPVSSASAATSSSFVPPRGPFPAYHPPSTPPPRIGGHFSSLLYAYVKPSRHPSLIPAIFWEDEEFTIIYDAYPKARVHLLMLPRKKQLAGLAELTAADVPLLDAMDARARWISSNLSVHDSAGRPIPVRCGFHAVPSLRLLHLHLVSADLQGVALKKKEHWNSFASPFFVSMQAVRAAVAESASTGVTTRPSAAAAAAALFNPTAASASPASSGPLPLSVRLLALEKHKSGPMRCNRLGCDLRCHNMPELRKHLDMCSKPYQQ